MVVTGRLHVRTYVNKDGIEVVAFEVDATHLGHDLSRGTSAFTRTPKPEQAEVAA